MATWCEELTHLKGLWCWERLKTGGEGDDRGWDGWMASLTQWTWVWVDSGSWWWIERPGVLQFMASQRVGHDWVTEWIYWRKQKIPTLKTLRCDERNRRRGKQMERYTMFVNWNNQYCPNEHYPRKCTDLMHSLSNYQRHFFFTDCNKKTQNF